MTDRVVPLVLDFPAKLLTFLRSSIEMYTSSCALSLLSVKFVPKLNSQEIYKFLIFDHSFRKSNGIIRRMKIIKCGMKENNKFSPFNGSLGHSVVWLSWRFIVSHLLVIILYSNEIHFFAITS